jgi:hypothetical protein
VAGGILVAFDRQVAGANCLAQVAAAVGDAGEGLRAPLDDRRGMSGRAAVAWAIGVGLVLVGIGLAAALLRSERTAATEDWLEAGDYAA